MNIRIIANIREIDKEWDALRQYSSSNNPQFVYAWQRAWLDTIGEKCKPRIVHVSDGGHSVILPLAVLTIKGVGRIVRFIGDPMLDFAEFFGTDEPCMVAGLNALLDKHSDALFILRQIPENSRTHTCLRSWVGEQRLTASDRFLVECPYLALENDFEKMLSQRGRNLRMDVRKKMRRVERTGNLELETITDPHRLHAIIGELIDLMQKRWTGHKESIWNDKQIRFFRTWTHEMAEMGCVVVYTMRLEGTMVSYRVCFSSGSTLWDYITAYDTDDKYARFSPGKILLAFIIKDAIKRNYKEFNFMRGLETYKSKWIPKIRRNFEFVVASRTLKSIVQYHAYTKAKSQLTAIIGTPI